MRDAGEHQLNRRDMENAREEGAPIAGRLF